MIGAEITIRPASLRGAVRVPGDKGISHRALLSAAMASGRSTIRNLADGDDGHALRSSNSACAEGLRLSTAQCSTGAEGSREPDAVIDCGNSGTTMACSRPVAGCPFLSVSGDSSLQGRPMGRVAHPCAHWGRVDGRADGEPAPLVIAGAAASPVAGSSSTS
jgi:3-phosphoshikimate 1-carboxyvinyltransferase